MSMSRNPQAVDLFALALLLGCLMIVLVPSCLHEAKPLAPQDSTCGGKPGFHCGCEALDCIEPCSACCDKMPCPVEGACGH